MTNAFLLCRSCGCLFRLGNHTLPDDEVPAHELDLQLFRAEHDGHVLEHAVRIADSSWYDRPVWDPMATAWFTVTTGHDQLLVRTWRSSIEEPRRSQVEVAAPISEGRYIETDDALLRYALDRHFYPHALRPAKVDKFLDVLRDLIRHLDASQMETSFDDADYPNAGIAPFPSHLRDELISRCISIFDPFELERVTSFIRANCMEDGALALRVYRPLILATRVAS